MIKAQDQSNDEQMSLNNNDMKIIQADEILQKLEIPQKQYKKEISQFQQQLLSSLMQHYEPSVMQNLSFIAQNKSIRQNKYVNLNDTNDTIDIGPQLRQIMCRKQNQHCNEKCKHQLKGFRLLSYYFGVWFLHFQNINKSWLKIFQQFYIANPICKYPLKINFCYIGQVLRRLYLFQSAGHLQIDVKKQVIKEIIRWRNNQPKSFKNTQMLSFIGPGTILEELYNIMFNQQKQASIQTTKIFLGVLTRQILRLLVNADFQIEQIQYIPYTAAIITALYKYDQISFNSQQLIGKFCRKTNLKFTKLFIQTLIKTCKHLEIPKKAINFLKSYQPKIMKQQKQYSNLKIKIKTNPFQYQNNQLRKYMCRISNCQCSKKCQHKLNNLNFYFYAFGVWYETYKNFGRQLGKQILLAICEIIKIKLNKKTISLLLSVATAVLYRLKCLQKQDFLKIANMKQFTIKLTQESIKDIIQQDGHSKLSLTFSNLGANIIIQEIENYLVIIYLKQKKQNHGLKHLILQAVMISLIYGQFQFSQMKIAPSAIVVWCYLTYFTKNSKLNYIETFKKLVRFVVEKNQCKFEEFQKFILKLIEKFDGKLESIDPNILRNILLQININ